MSKDDRVSRDTDSPDVALPGTANKIARERPALWEAFQRLGEEASRAGPLDDRTRRLVLLRHAKAEQGGQADELRTLALAGRRQCGKVAASLTELDLVPEPGEHSYQILPVPDRPPIPGGQR